MSASPESELQDLLDHMPESIANGRIELTPDGLELGLMLQRQSAFVRAPLAWIAGWLIVLLSAIGLAAALMSALPMLLGGLAIVMMLAPMFMSVRRTMSLRGSQLEIGHWKGPISEVEVRFHGGSSWASLEFDTPEGTWVCNYGLTAVKPDTLRWIADVLEATKQLPEPERGTEADRPAALRALQQPDGS